MSVERQNENHEEKREREKTEKEGDKKVQDSAADPTFVSLRCFGLSALMAFMGNSWAIAPIAVMKSTIWGEVRLLPPWVSSQDQSIVVNLQIGPAGTVVAINLRIRFLAAFRHRHDRLPELS
jgi:hypothetical protein